MDSKTIKSALEKRFTAKPLSQKRQIVFWYDADGGFALEVDTLLPDGVKILRLNRNVFETKRTLEHLDTDSSYLIYAPYARPGDKENYLLDIELYSDQFSADRASLVMNDLGVGDLSLKAVVDKYIAFFTNKARQQAFARIAHPVKTPEDVETVMVAVLAGTRTTDAEGILRAVLLDSLDDDQNTRLGEMRKLKVTHRFWKIAEDLCGFSSDHPSLRGLLQCLLLTATAEQLHLRDVSGWNMSPPKLRSRAVVFIDHWFSHNQDCKRLEQYSKETWSRLELDRAAQEWDMKAISEAYTFEAFDLMIMEDIAKGLERGDESFERWEAWIDSRKRSYWWSTYKDSYEALQAAINLQVLHKEFDGRFKETTAKQMAQAYTNEYCRFDREYRNFCTARSKVASDFLHPTAELVENLYTNWFLPKLMDRWNQIIEGDLAKNWHIEGVLSQKDFFDSKARETAGDRNKVFVLISDGLRYEACQELAEALEQSTFAKPELGCALSSIPSYTALGMAALLPNREVRWDSAGCVTVDGKPTGSSGDRMKILQDTFTESVVINYRDLMAWSRDEARAKINGSRVIYIYHNTIDMVGDKVATEHKTFDAVAETVQELKDAVLKICNSLNGTYVYITSDHGFLFQQRPLEESDKVAPDKMDAVVGGRRFIVAEKGKSFDGALEISLDWMLGPGADLAVYVPKGNIRFKAPGGAKYVHGGASLQEVIVPVMLHTHVRKHYTQAEAARRAEVELTTTDKRITNSQFAVSFFQSSPVGGKVTPRRLKVALWKIDGEEKKVSTEEILVADATSDKPEERTYVLRLHLNSNIPNGDYVLRLIDEETSMEYRRINFQVSLAISGISFFS